MTVTSEWFLPVFILIHKSFITLSHPCTLRRGRIEWIWWATDVQTRSAHYTDTNKPIHERKTLILWFQKDWVKVETECFKIKKKNRKERSSHIQAQISSIISNNSKENTITGRLNCFLLKCSLFKMYPSVKVPL